MRVVIKSMITAAMTVRTRIVNMDNAVFDLINSSAFSMGPPHKLPGSNAWKIEHTWGKSSSPERKLSIFFKMRFIEGMNGAVIQNRKKRCVILFDIDGTLLTGPSGGQTAGLRAMHYAAMAVAGDNDHYKKIEFAGRTDYQIARLLLQAAGEKDPPRNRVEQLVDRYLAHLREGTKKLPYTVLGAPRRVVGRLRDDGAIVGLGTGNVRAGGTIKLESAGIDDLFDMENGGFGEDGDTRAEVLEAGARRLDETRQLPVIIVGDTPYDVQAAHEIGALCIGVPYRDNDSDVLEKAGADAIVDEIGDALILVVEQLLEDNAL
jgi:phosphoglycolate phosphatase-like HAD superfamily hydrolase